MDETHPAHSRADAAERLVDAVRQLASAQSLDDVTHITKITARELAAADGISFVLRDGNRCYYVDEYAIAPLWKGRRFPIDACVSGWAMKHRQVVLIPDVFQDQRVPHDAYRPTFVKSMAMVPIRTLSPIGAIGVYWQSTYQPSAETLRWLQSLADSTALALELLQGQREMEEAQLEAQLLRQANADLRHEQHQPLSGGLIRMCFITKRIEVDGQWLSIEAFLHQQLGVQVTHGLSPEGLARLDADEAPLLALAAEE